MVPYGVQGTIEEIKRSQRFGQKTTNWLISA